MTIFQIFWFVFFSGFFTKILFVSRENRHLCYRETPLEYCRQKITTFCCLVIVCILDIWVGFVCCCFVAVAAAAV